MDDRRITPRRPTLTPVFSCSLVFWFACGATYSLCLSEPADICLRAAIICIVVSVCAGVLLVVAKGGLILWLVATAVAGCSLSLVYAASVHASCEKLSDDQFADLQVTVLEDSADFEMGNKVLCRANLSDGRSVRLLAKLPSGSSVFCGQTLTLAGTLERTSLASEQSAWSKGTLLLARVKTAEVLSDHSPIEAIVNMRCKAISAIGSQDNAHALVQALCCGYRENLKNTEEYSGFKTCGLAHMVSVSGAHLVIVTGFISALLNALHVTRKASVALLVLFIAAYTVFAGMPYSCLRAAVMSSAGILSVMGKRRPSSQNALGISIFCLLVTSPYASLSVSFGLSVLSTAGIVMFCPLVQFVLERALRRRVVVLSSPLSLTIAAGILSQLYSCSLFNQLPIVAPVANVVCAPLLPISCALGLMGACVSMVNAPIASVLIAMAAMITTLMNLLVQLLANVPYACIPIAMDTVGALVLSIAFAFVIWFNWERFLKPVAWLVASILAGSVFLGLGFSPPNDCVAMLDVGQGDSFLLRSQGKTLLIDTGNHDGLLIEQLARCRIAHLDGVLITHADDDHCGSLDALERSVDVGVVYVASDMLACADEDCIELIGQAERTAETITGLKKGDMINLGGFKATVIWPKGLADSGGNADSIVLRVEHGNEGGGAIDFTALFTGDAEKDVIDCLIEEGSVGDVDMLKVGHHGSKNSLTLEQARFLMPEIALIGVGKGNRYGHPAQEALDVLANVGCMVFRTDVDGGKRFDFMDGHVSVHNL